VLLWETVHFKRGDTITAENQTERYMYFVAEGVHRAYFIDPKGQDISVQFTYDPDYSGVPDSFWSEKPSRFNLETITTSRCLRISRTDLDASIKKWPILERWLRLLAQDFMIGFADRQIAVLSYTAEERFRRLAQNSPRAMQLIPQKHLASYLGMTAETFSRLRRKYVS